MCVCMCVYVYVLGPIWAVVPLKKKYWPTQRDADIWKYVMKILR